MCGIVGLVNLSGRPLSERENLRSVLTGLAHRGPDDSGELTSGPVWLGNTRLAILDLNRRSRQPMISADGQLAITYNGEIVNYDELRAELERLGHRFATSSDTEVVLAAYRQWREGCLDRFAGMFAFGLHDRRTGQIMLARDRLGVKPLYYGVARERLAFCSELKGVTALPGIGRRLNTVALSSFLSFRQSLTAASYFQGVQALRPGHWLRIHQGRCEIRRWWTPPIALARGRPAHVSLGQLIGDVVRQTAVSDVPVAVLLSGGLDSAIIASELSVSQRGLLAITASVAGADYDETATARATAAAVGARHMVVPVTARDYLARADDLIRCKDQPLGMHNEVALYMLAQQIKRHASVVVSGEGADELFAGYGRIFRLPYDVWRRRLGARLPGRFRRRLLSAAGADRDNLDASAVDLFLSRYCYWPIEEKISLFSEPMREAVAGDTELYAAVTDVFAQAGPDLSAQLFHFFVTTHLRGLLEVTDSSFMAAGVEVRVPFTDHRIVELVTRLPERDRLRWRGPWARARALLEPVEVLSERRDITKYALRREYRHQLPRAVLEGRKLPFPVPLTRWLVHDQHEEIDRLLFGKDALIGAIFDRRRLRRWLDTMRQQPPTDDRVGRRVWLLITTELWLRQNFPDGVGI